MLDRYVPRSLVDRPKAGFGLPIDDWLRGPLRPWAEDLLASTPVREHLAVDLVSEVWAAHQSRHLNHAYELWDVLMFATWATSRSK